MKIFHYRSFRYIVAGGCAALLISAGAISWKYYSVSKASPGAELSPLAMEPSSDISLGQTIRLSMILRCPWNVRPDSVKVAPGKGTQSFGRPTLSRKKTGWGYWEWSVGAEIQPYLNGRTEKGVVTVELDRPVNGGTASLSAEIPEFESGPLDTGSSQELSVAGKISPQAGRKSPALLIAATLIILAAIAGLAIYLMRRKKGAAGAVLTPWQIAMIEICELRSDLGGHRLSPAFCFTKLTDIVRKYLERRFTIRAESRTTYEFLEDMRRHESPLSERHKEFLRSFLQAADLVKFAKLPADEAILGNALSSAEELIKSTTPAETAPGAVSGKEG